MYWWIILVILTLGIVIGVIGEIKNNYCIWGGLTAVLCGAFAFILIVGIAKYSVTIPQEICVFEQQKAYIENHVSKNDIEDAALTTKKIELNEWLYNAKYSNERWNGWTLYPNSIQDLQEIK